MKHKVVLLLILIGWLPQGAWAASESTLKLGLGMKYFSEDSQAVNFQQAVERFKSEDVEVGESEVLSFGYTASTFWFHEKIPAGALPKASVLILEYALIDYVEFYLVQGDKITQFTVGDEFAFRERPISYPEFVFPLVISENEEAAIYLRIRTSSSFQIPLTLMPESSFKRILTDRSVLMGMYFGIVLIMVLYNFFIFTSTRERLFLLYVMYGVGWGLLQATTRGYTYQYLWPESPGWNSVAIVAVGSFAGVGMFGFSREFLNIPRHLPKIDLVFKTAIAAYALLMLISFVIPYSVIIKGFISLTLLMTLVTLSCASYLVFNTDAREPRFYLIAFGAYFTTAVVFALNKFGVVPRSPFTENAVQVGEVIQLALLSLGLADRLNTLQKEKQVTQKALDHSRQEVTRELARSEDLEMQNNALASEMNLASQQLIQAEKLSSLGQQVAGILHEVSSPLSHALAGARGTKKSQDELYAMLHGMVGEDEAAQEVWTELKKHFDEQSTQLSYVEVGLDKIREMNQAVRNYSRSDARSRSFENIRPLVEEVCVVMRNKVKFLKVELDCAELPAISCHRSQFAQVFTNLIGNAADAIEERQEKAGTNEADGHIRISGKVSSREGRDGLEICVEDNGTGVPVELRDKINDAFFTTKPIGKGTGLGMAITGRILKNHDAVLSIEDSELGGAAFNIWVPSSVVEG